MKPGKPLRGLISPAAALLVTAGALLFASVGSAAPRSVRRAAPTLAGAALDAPRATRLARAGGFELIDFHPCSGGAPGCALLAVRQPDGEAFVYRVSDRPCAGGTARCLGGFAASADLRSGRKQPGSRPSSAKVSAKPGEDGAPSDPQDEAQAAATNEIIEALGDGKYEGDYEEFWDDLESIQTWTNPSWREPDPPPPVKDSVRATGLAGSLSPAVLISGRYQPAIGAKECRRWAGYTSSAASIADVGNWIGNAAFDGCDSEVAVFSDRGAADLIGTERRWSRGTDHLDYPLEGRLKVPTTVWVAFADRDYASEKAEVEAEIARANEILAESRCGIELGPITYHDKTSALLQAEQPRGCGNIATELKPRVGFHEDRMNVYILSQLMIEGRAGVACTQESDNVILLDQDRGETSLVHEYGHWFDLWHTNLTDMPLVDVRNVMSDNEKDKRDKLTAGQCYRASFSRDSYINKQGLRSGKTKKCAHLQDADDECPGIKNEF